MDKEKKNAWKVLSHSIEVDSPWLKVIKEQLLDDDSKELEYWRVEKADSLVIVTIKNGKFILPKEMYRPGVSRRTLDFPGGRVDPTIDLSELAKRIVQREFTLSETDFVKSMKAINSKPWYINSSFENQQLYGYFMEIKEDVQIDSDQIGAEYEVSDEGLKDLLDKLLCLQCRGLVLEWYPGQDSNL